MLRPLRILHLPSLGAMSPSNGLEPLVETITYVVTVAHECRLGSCSQVPQQWPHNVGPIMSYMTACGSDDCSTFNTTSAEWFKIAELGMNSSNTWYQGYLSMS